MTTSSKLKLAGVALGAALMSTTAMAGSTDAKCGSGKCGGEKKVEKKVDSKCGSGKCGGEKAMKKADSKMGNGKCGGEKKVVTKDTDAKCGAGKCG